MDRSGGGVGVGGCADAQGGPGGDEGVVGEGFVGPFLVVGFLIEQVGELARPLAVTTEVIQQLRGLGLGAFQGDCAISTGVISFDCDWKRESSTNHACQYTSRDKPTRQGTDSQVSVRALIPSRDA